MAMQKRWTSILNLLKTNNEISSVELAKELDTSVATIRRDLVKMEELNLISRYHGGAKALNQETEFPIVMRSEQNSDYKVKVGRYAATLIQDHQMVYIDAGSATLAMIPYITAKNITVVTIGIPQIIALIEKKINTIVIGGSIRESTSAITGFKTIEQVSDYCFDIAFLGTNAVHKKIGLSTTNDMEAACKAKVIERSSKTYVLADESKFNKICPCAFSPLNKVRIITNGTNDYEYDSNNIIIV